MIEPTPQVATVSGQVEPATSSGYEVTVHVPLTYTFTFCDPSAGATYDTWLCVLDDQGNILAQNDDACGLLSNISLRLEPGEYTVAVSGFDVSAGSYTLAYSREEVPVGPACNARETVVAGILRPRPLSESAGLFAVPAGGSGAIAELDPVIGVELRRFPAPEATSAGPDALAYDGQRLWFLNGFGSDRLFELDPTSGAVLDSDPIGAGSGDYDGLAVLAGTVFVLDYGADSIHAFDPRTDTITRSLSIRGMDLIGGLAGITEPDALLATGVNEGGPQVFEIDPLTGDVLASFPHGLSFAAGVATISGEIYAGDLDGTTVRVFDRAGAPQRNMALDYPISALGADDAPPPADPEPRAQTVQGSVTSVRGEAYTVSVCESGDYTFTLCDFGGSASFDTWLCLVDGAGNLLAQDDDACDPRSALRASLDPGTYTLAVSGVGGAEGEYTLAYYGTTANGCPTCNTRFAVLRPEIRPEQDFQTVSGRTTARSGEVHPFEVTEELFYTFSFCTEGGTATFDTWLCLLDAEGNAVAENDDACGLLSHVQMTLLPGSYGIAVSGFAAESGSYTLAYAASEAPAFQPCNGRLLAEGARIQPASVPATVAGSVTATSGAVHPFTVHRRSEHVFTFCSDGGGASYDTWLCLVPAGGEVITENDDACGVLSQITLTLDPGEYGIAVSGFGTDAGAYTLAYYTTGPEADICSGRAVVSRGVIRPTSAPATQKGAIDSTTADGFAVEVCEAGTYTFTMCSGGGGADFDTWLCLLDGNGVTVAENDDRCDVRSEISLALDPGSYTLAVSGFLDGAGSYAVSFHTDVPNACDERGRQLPGDCTQDGVLDISDAICLLGFLFLGRPPALPCGDGTAGNPANLALLDHSVNAELDLPDATGLLRFLFLGGPPPPGGLTCAGIEGCPPACSE